MIFPPNHIPSRSPSRQGFTLVEVAVASTVLAILLVGVLSALVQSRRLTEGSIYQNSATTIMQGYIEQMKNMEFASLPYVTSGGTLVAGGGTAAAEIPTRLDEVTADTLLISNCGIPDLNTVVASTTPSGVTDNLKVIDVAQTTTTADDLRMHVWVCIKDISGATADATQVRSITILYTWQVNDGSRSRSFKGSLRTIRSAVPTF